MSHVVRSVDKQQQLQQSCLGTQYMSLTTCNTCYAANALTPTMTAVKVASCCDLVVTILSEQFSMLALRLESHKKNPTLVHAWQAY